MKRRKYGRNPMAALSLLSRASAGSATDAGRQVVVRAMFERLRDGTADPEDFDRVVKALNTAKIRALEIGAPPLIAAIQAGQRALTQCRRRYLENGRFGFSGPELQAMHQAIYTYEAIENASSALQMEQAWETSKRSIELQRKEKSG